MLDLILALALSLPAPWYPPGQNPETPEQYRERVAVIASAIADASGGDRELAVAVLVKTRAESRFALEIHEGSKLGDSGRAICLGQLHRKHGVSVEEWRGFAGTDRAATSRCITEVTRQLRAYRAWCRSWGGAFSAYATGKGCSVITLGKARAAQVDRWMRVRQ